MNPLVLCSWTESPGESDLYLISERSSGMRMLEKEASEQFLVRSASNSVRSSRNGVCWVFSRRTSSNSKLLQTGHVRRLEMSAEDSQQRESNLWLFIPSFLLCLTPHLAQPPRPYPPPWPLVNVYPISDFHFS